MTPAPEEVRGHLPMDLMARLLSGAVEPDEVQGLVLPHLLALCPECRAVGRELERLRREVGHWSSLVAATEGPEAPAQWARLAALPYPAQLAAIDAEPSLQTWGLCRLLHRLSEQAARNDPAAAAQRANVALRICEHLGDEYDPAWVTDLRALTHAHLGNARRRLGELAAAGDAVDTAHGLRAAGTGYPAVAAETMRLEALLWRDRQQLAEASGLLESAYQTYRGKGPAPDLEAVDPHLAGLVRVHQGWCRYHAGQPEVALGLLGEAEGLVDQDREPRLLVAIHHGRAWAAVLLGRFAEAEGPLRLAIELAGQHGGDGDRLRLRRLEGRLDHELGQRGPAEQLLRRTYRELMEQGLGVDAALTVMDLAELYLKENAAAALRDLADELLPAFSAGVSGHDLPTGSVFALLLFQEACRSDRLTPGMLQGLAGQLERLRRASLAWWSSRGTVLAAETYPMPVLEP